MTLQPGFAGRLPGRAMATQQPQVHVWGTGLPGVSPLWKVPRLNAWKMGQGDSSHTKAGFGCSRTSWLLEVAPTPGSCPGEGLALGLLCPGNQVSCVFAGEVISDPSVAPKGFPPDALTHHLDQPGALLHALTDGLAQAAGPRQAPGPQGKERPVRSMISGSSLFMRGVCAQQAGSADDTLCASTAKE
jgi:hypothetical protein